MSQPAQARLHAVVEGYVQGVNFRQTTVREARRLGLAGWVRNTSQGEVECVAEGDRAQLERFLVFLNQGPPAARVFAVRAEWLSASGEFRGFDVRW